MPIGLTGVLLGPRHALGLSIVATVLLLLDGRELSPLDAVGRMAAVAAIWATQALVGSALGFASGAVGWSRSSYERMRLLLEEARDQRLLLKQTLELSFHLPDGLPPLHCDRTRIRQVILNLLSNAGRLTDSGGAQVWVAAEGDQMAFSVADTGPGISTQDQARIFARADVDILRTGDDVSWQKGMLMSPAVWRQWLKPRLARVIAAAREVKPDILIWYHSDGDCRAIIPELIEIGGRHPQPRAARVHGPGRDQAALW